MLSWRVSEREGRLCDLLSRVVLAPSEVPVGVITAVVGAPIFIYLLKKK